MNSASDLSLYEIALNSEQSSLLLQINPASLKSVVGSFIDLLTEQKIPAIVWAKLPRGEVWQSDLEHYSLLSFSQGVYQFKTQRDEGGDDVAMVSTTIVPSHLTTDSTSLPPKPEDSIVSLKLQPDSPLRRDYFLLVWSTRFQGMIFSHRPRSAQLARVGHTTEAGHGTEQEHASEEGQERRQHLLALCSFERETVKRVLHGIEQALLSKNGTDAAIVTNKDLTLEALIQQWQQKIAEIPPVAPDVFMLGQLFTRQLQRQDEIWQRYSNYRKQAEMVEVLQLQNEELSNSVRSRDDFLNNVGQELRTPLTTIKTALTLLNSPNLKPPQRQRYMDLIAKECDRQSSLITSLLDLVHLEQVSEHSTLQAVKLIDVVPGVVSTYQPVAEEKGVMLAYTVPADLPPVSCMSNWLKQIVINLLHNGIKFTPTGGQVWVRAKQQGDYVQLEFRDTGIGIPANEIPKIFERFYRVRQSIEESSGAGLGLTIVQQLLLHCGGSISVKSKVGEGTTFVVLLPIHRSASEPPAEVD